MSRWKLYLKIDSIYKMYNESIEKDLSQLSLYELLRLYEKAFNSMDYIIIGKIQDECKKRNVDFWKEYTRHVSSYHKL